jgi:hypothetical protein
MILSDIAVNNYGDYVLDSHGDITYVVGADAITQYIRLALTTQLGTYRFDTGFGSRLHEVIGMATSHSQIENLLRVYTIDCLKSIPFIQTVDDISFTYSSTLPVGVIMNVAVTAFIDDAYTLMAPVALDMQLG